MVAVGIHVSQWPHSFERQPWCEVVTLCFICVRDVASVQKAQRDWPFKCSQRSSFSISFATITIVSVAVRYWLLKILTTCLDLSRFYTSWFSICKSTVHVSFPLTQLDLGPYGPAGVGTALVEDRACWHLLGETSWDSLCVSVRACSVQPVCSV